MSTTSTYPYKASPAKIRQGLKFFRICAFLTGTFLLLMVAEMILKYGFHVSGVFGGVNVFLIIQITHGWLFVLYLLADYNLYSKLKWGIGQFLLVALGGIVPFYSFIVESRLHREVSARLEPFEALEAAAAKRR